MIAALDKPDWDAISAIANCLGVLVTSAAIVVALFGEQIRRWHMRPRLSISCGATGLLFQEDKYNGPEQIFMHLRLLVTNFGKESAKNLTCVLAAIRTWDGEKMCLDARYRPQKMIWSIDREDTLTILVPESSALLEVGVFSGNPRIDARLEIFPSKVNGVLLTSGRYEVELILPSDHDLHYHGFFEFAWENTRDGKASQTFAIQESRRIKSD